MVPMPRPLEDVTMQRWPGAGRETSGVQPGGLKVLSLVSDHGVCCFRVAGMERGFQGTPTQRQMEKQLGFREGQRQRV